jgi:hypothetical protein
MGEKRTFLSWIKRKQKGLPAPAAPREVRKIEPQPASDFEKIDQLIAETTYGVLDAVQKAPWSPEPRPDPDVFKLVLFDPKTKGPLTIELKPPVKLGNRDWEGHYVIRDAGGRDIFICPDGTFNGWGARAPLHRQMARKIEAQRAEVTAAQASPYGRFKWVAELWVAMRLRLVEFDARLDKLSDPSAGRKLLK